jgi:DNA topoisomerase-1
VYLAPDPDREGEAIAAHLAMQLLPMMKDKSKMQRVTFNEITQKAVKAAFEHARDVDENLVDAQQTRRVLDRLVGYQISPLLWDKVRRGLSAGRVQTVALRLIVEREREINAFKPVEYWTSMRCFHPGKAGRSSRRSWSASTASRARGERQPTRTARSSFPPMRCRTRGDRRGVGSWRRRSGGASVEKKERSANPTAPFTTSKLQQDASGAAGLQRAPHDGRGAAFV